MRRIDRHQVLVSLLILFAVLRVVSTYREMCQTYDEADHLACGMQWLDRGQYDYEPMHPVVARIAIASLPYLDGVRSFEDANKLREGNRLLSANGNYWRTLTLARLGILPFFIVACLILYFWTAQLYDKNTAVIAVACFTFLPLVLAHSTLATTDIPVTATFLGFAYYAWKWLRQPNPSTTSSVILGSLLALTICAKFSTVFFLIPVAGLVAIMWWFQRPLRERWYFQNVLSPKRIVIILGTTFLVIWALYRFSIGSIVLPRHIDKFESTLSNKFDRSSWMFSLVHWLAFIPIPAPAFFNGLLEILLVNHNGWAIYLMGNPMFGKASALFFPVALLVKNPSAFLLLVTAGSTLVVNRFVRFQNISLVPLLMSVPVLVLCLFSSINLGLRHLLPIYPFLAMLAAVAIKIIWAKNRVIGKSVVVILVCWICVSSVAAHPNYLSYFNEMGNAKPDYFLMDSDLDWGQDAHKMADTLRVRSIEQVCVGYHGVADLVQLGFPSFDTLRSGIQPSSKWIAISKTRLYADTGNAWLLKRQPVARVGASMLLYQN